MLRARVFELRGGWLNVHQRALELRRRRADRAGARSGALELTPAVRRTVRIRPRALFKVHPVLV